MASTSKCPYCGGVVRSDEKSCPHCGAENALFIEDSPRTIQHPTTIEELQEYCAERGMPLLRMRFFIGEDYKEPKAFGIYRDGKNVVVYKNKADGSRAVRYKGPDEEHAVNELFQKLLSECHNRGIYPNGKPVTRSSDAGTVSRSLGPAPAPEPEPEEEPKLPEGENVPKTLAELQALCGEKQIPLESLGFVIGNTSRRDFSGLTRKEGKYFIYRTKKDGSRVYTYQSEDEAAAVARYYSMIMNAVERKEHPPEKKKRARFGSLEYAHAHMNNGKFTRLGCLSAIVWWCMQMALFMLVLFLVIGIIAILISSIVHRNDGYYMAPDSTVYYQDGGDWYAYDPDDYYDWYEVDDFPEDNYKDYLMEDGWEADWDGVSYSEGSVWSEPSSSDSSDSYSSSDYDSWDSGGTDWDSDW